MQESQSVVEIFKTNVDCETVANGIVEQLAQVFPKYEINFDLDDCDKILRIQSSIEIDIDTILNQVSAMNVEVIWLE